MRKIGKPIIAREEYANPVDRELRAYLWETIYGPLFQKLEEAGVETDPRYQAIGETPEIRNASDELELFPPSFGSLRMKRHEVPQITAADRDDLEAYLATRSITTFPDAAYPEDLRPTQEGFYPDALEHARLHPSAHPVLVSQDSYIIDGHHHWLAALQDHPYKRLPVLRCQAQVRGLINAIKAFPGVRFKNARDPLTAALQDGRIWYADGKFTGKFTAATSRRLREMGATWNANARTFSLPLDRVPMELRTVLAQSQETSAALHKETANLLRQMEGTIPVAPAALKFRKAVDTISGDLHKQLERTIPALESISIPPTITPEMRANITRELTENLELYIKKFAAEEIPELRHLVEANAFEGGRTPQLARIIEARWGVGKRKAKFLADQETSLLVSKYREQTYKRLGVQRYVWSTSHDERVRPDHQRLDKKIFSWDSPPVVETITGRRAHPGEDFRCLPGDSQVSFVHGVKKAFRRWYSGKLTTIIVESGKTLRATPNHPVLTRRGWKPIGLLDHTDEVAEIRQELLFSLKTNPDQSISTIGEIFEALRESGLSETLPGEREQFHGDGTNRDVDVVYAKRPLRINRKSAITQRLHELSLAVACFFTSSKRCFLQTLASIVFCHRLSALMRCAGQRLAFVDGHPGHADCIGFRNSPDRYTALNKPATNDRTTNFKPLGNRQFAIPREIIGDDRVDIDNTPIPSRLAFSAVRSISFSRFVGHVYNLETEDGYYATANVVVSNCRCTAIPIVELPGMSVLP